MLHEREELHMGEAALLDMGDERFGDLGVAEEPSGIGGITPPTAQVDFIDRDWCIETDVLAA
jgi:hypothetical protein